jgi:phosphatidylserine decarboxylase
MLIGISLALSIVFFAIHLQVFAILCFIFFLFCLFFFRNPRRVSDAGKGILISPADGKILDIRQVTEQEFIQGEATRVSIFMSPVDVHVNRAPCEGRVTRVHHRDGEFAVAMKKDIEKTNERNYILLEREGEKVLIVQIAGFLARRITSYVKEGDYVKRGDPVGIIAFGSRVDTYFPKGYETMVKLHGRAKAGVTTLARAEGER